MAGVPKAGRPQEPTGTSRGGIACSTATMQDPWQWFPASDSVTGSPAPSTIDVGERPSPIFTPAGRHRRDIRDSVVWNGHRPHVTCGDAVIMPQTLASGVVGCWLLLAGCDMFAACSPA